MNKNVLLKYANLFLNNSPRNLKKILFAGSDFSSKDIEEFIKQIGINRDDPKIEKIKELKKKKFLYPKDEALIKLLWWQAKQESLQDKIGTFKIQLDPTKKTNLDKVAEELNRKVLEALRDYNKYPRDQK